MDFVKFDTRPAVSGHLGIITLQRSQALNALSYDMIMALHDQLIAWAANDDIKAVIIKSASERAFCAGGDIRALYEGRDQFGEQLKFFEAEYRLNNLIGSYPKPYISLLNGIVMGGGAGISVHGSHCVACEDLIFAMPETGIGLYPDVGAGHFLNKCPGYLGTYLALSGARIHAADACYANLVDFYISSNHFDEVIDALSKTQLPAGSAHQKVSHVLQEFAIQPDKSEFAQLQNVIDGVFCMDSVYRIMQFLEEDDSEWSKAVHAHLIQKSPMSLSVTLEMMRRLKNRSLSECMMMDFTLVQSFLKSHDLYEGIRAVVIDKDMQPKWQYEKLDNISDDQVNAYFSTEGKSVLNLG